MFDTLISGFSWKNITAKINSCTENDVKQALSSRLKKEQTFIALLSPAAKKFLPEMSQQSSLLTCRYFGKTIQLYAPLYISNECEGGCTYCGFSAGRDYKKITLTIEEAVHEARIIRESGIDSILLLTGDSPQKVPFDFIKKIVSAMHEIFSSVSIEMYPMSEEQYRQLLNAGCDGLTIYQETYNKEIYVSVHRFGRKKDYTARLTVPESAARAGMRRINIGALLGLADYRTEIFFLFMHHAFLEKKFWQTSFSVSFPRLQPLIVSPELRPAPDSFLLQAVCAFRLMFPESGITISTRESAEIRDILVKIGVTRISAGSKTSPGAYALGIDAGSQFSVRDERSVSEVVKNLTALGYDPINKDWDKSFT